MTILTRLAGDYRKNFGNNRRARVLGMTFLFCVVGCGGFLWGMTPGRDQRIRMKGDIATIDGALEKFKGDFGMYPRGMEGLVVLTTRPAKNLEKWEGPYLKAIPKDPWGKDYVYRTPGKYGSVFEVVSLGPDGKSGTWDDYRE